MFRKDFTLENLSEDPAKTFTPMRILLKYDDLYNEITNFNEGEKEYLKMKDGMIEAVFSWNEIFPSGLDSLLGFYFGKTFAFLDSFQIVLSFIVSGLKDEKAKELFEDIRIAMQNFMIFMMNKSYYSAIVSYRKIIEGMIWIKYLNENKFPEDGRIDGESTYTSFLKTHKKSLEYFKLSSEYIHAKKLFLFNDLSGKQDKMNSFQKLVQDCFNEIKTSYNSIFQIPWIKENEIMSRFEVIYNRIEIIRSEYELKDWEIKEKFTIKQKRNIISDYEQPNIEDEYKNSLIDLTEKNIFSVTDTIKESTFTPMNVIYSFDIFSKKVGTTKIMESIKRISNGIINKNLHMINASMLKLYYLEPQILELCDLSTQLFSITLKKKNDILTAIRLLVEEFIFNIVTGKNNTFLETNVLINLMHKIDKTIINKTIIKHKHILITNRPKSISSEGKTSGTLNADDSNLKSIILEVEKLIHKIKKGEIKI